MIEQDFTFQNCETPLNPYRDCFVVDYNDCFNLKAADLSFMTFNDC